MALNQNWNTYHQFKHEKLPRRVSLLRTVVSRDVGRIVRKIFHYLLHRGEGDCHGGLLMQFVVAFGNSHEFEDVAEDE